MLLGCQMLRETLLQNLFQIDVKVKKLKRSLKPKEDGI